MTLIGTDHERSGTPQTPLRGASVQMGRPPTNDEQPSFPGQPKEAFPHRLALAAETRRSGTHGLSAELLNRNGSKHTLHVV